MGGGVYHSNIINGTLIGKNGSVGIESPNNQTTIVGVETVGYKVPARFRKRIQHYPDKSKRRLYGR